MQELPGGFGQEPVDTDEPVVPPLSDHEILLVILEKVDRMEKMFTEAHEAVKAIQAGGIGAMLKGMK